jgi:hypothetical protein
MFQTSRLTAIAVALQIAAVLAPTITLAAIGIPIADNSEETAHDR